MKATAEKIVRGGRLMTIKRVSVEGEPDAAAKVERLLVMLGSGETALPTSQGVDDNSHPGEFGKVSGGLGASGDEEGELAARRAAFADVLTDTFQSREAFFQFVNTLRKFGEVFPEGDAIQQGEQVGDGAHVGTLSSASGTSKKNFGCNTNLISAQSQSEHNEDGTISARYICGPWKVDRFYVNDANGHPVANCEASLADDPILEARTRLIAAAPELLDALKKLAGWANLSEDHPTSGNLAKEVKAAIAKAEGRAS